MDEGREAAYFRRETEEAEISQCKRHLTLRQRDAFIDEYNAGFLTPEERDRFVQEYNAECSFRRIDSKTSQELATPQNGSCPFSNESPGTIEKPEIQRSNQKQSLEFQRLKSVRFREIHSKKELDKAMERYPELRFAKSFQKNYHKAEIYCEFMEVLDSGKMECIIGHYKGFAEKYNDISYHRVRSWGEGKTKPRLVMTLEKREMRRLHEIANGGPQISIESMGDVNDLIRKHQQVQDMSEFSGWYRQCQTYFAVKDDWSMTQQQLSEIHGVSNSTIGYWRAGREPKLVAILRILEEEGIVGEWAESHRKDDIKSRSSGGALKQTEWPLERKREGVTFGDEHETIVCKIESSVAFSLLKELVSRLWRREPISSTVAGLCREIGRTRACVLYADMDADSFMNSKQLAMSGEVLCAHQNHIKTMLSECLGRSNSERQIRVGIVDHKLYTWVHDTNPNNMVDVWANQFFYFRSKTDLVHLVDTARTRLGLGIGMYESIEQINRLLDQVLPIETDSRRMKSRHIIRESQRLQGETLRFLLDAAGLPTKYLENRINKVTAFNGLGGIMNPRFLEGKELEVCRARLVAVIESDGSIRPNGRLAYCEGDSDRFDRVEDNLSAWGRMTIRRHNPVGKNYIETMLPTPLGSALMFWGIEPGDKTIRNGNLPSIIMNGSWEAHVVYLEELIPEDGCFRPQGGFVWTRSVALHAGDKTEAYQFENKVSKTIVDFIKEHKDGYDERMRYYRLYWNPLKRFQKSSISRIAESAHELISAILSNPSCLIQDEVTIAKNLGIEVNLCPVCVTYYERTGKVSVSWRASTDGLDNILRWALLCPPNDTRKRKRVREWLLSRPKDMERVREEVIRKGIEITEWWSYE